MKLGRRTFLSTLAIPFIPQMGLGQGLGSEAGRFSSILQQIGGVANISPFLVNAVEQELQTTYGPHAPLALIRALDNGPLEARLAQADNDVKLQVQFVARLLYTGEVTREGRLQALYYPWCLAWRAVSFATAPGLCSGPGFGHWAVAPAEGGAQ